MNLTCHLVPRIPLPAAAAAAARLAAALAANTESRPDTRLQALVTLYNAAYDSGSKAAALMQALAYAKQAGLSDLLLPVIRAQADGWAAELKLGAGAERQLYTACADTLGACTRKPRTAAREAYRLLSKCLATYEVGAGWVGGCWAAAAAAGRYKGGVQHAVWQAAGSSSGSQLGTAKHSWLLCELLCRTQQQHQRGPHMHHITICRLCRLAHCCCCCCLSLLASAAAGCICSGAARRRARSSAGGC